MNDLKIETIELPGMDIGKLGKIEFDMAKLNAETIKFWQVDKEYKVGDVVVCVTKYGDELTAFIVRCKEAHTSSSVIEITETDTYWEHCFEFRSLLSKYSEGAFNIIGEIDGETLVVPCSELLLELEALYEQTEKNTSQLSGIETLLGGI